MWLAGDPQHNSAGPQVCRSDLQPQTKRASAHTRTHTHHKRTHTQTNNCTRRIHIRFLRDTHARTLQLIGKQVSGEEEKVPVQHMQAEYAISSS